MYPLVLYVFLFLCVIFRIRIKDINTLFEDVPLWRVPTNRIYIFIESVLLLLVIISTFSTSLPSIQVLVSLYMVTYAYEVYRCDSGYTYTVYNRIQICRMLLLFILVILLAVYELYASSYMCIVSITLLVLFL